MEEEQHFDHALKAIDEAIQAADVGQFVGKDGLRSHGIKARKEAKGNEDDRTEQSHAHGRGDPDGLQEAHGPAQPCASDQTCQPFRLGDGPGRRPEPVEPQPASCGSQA
jgi:hypothetical protein